MEFSIKTVSTNLFIVDDVMSKSPLGRRMTIIRLKNGELVLHSPIYLEGNAKNELDNLGKVSTILVPNEWHTRDTKQVQAQYPDSKIIVPKQSCEHLSNKFPTFNTYENHWDNSLSMELPLYLIDGLKKPEAVFFHEESKTLIVTDLFFNFRATDFSGLTKWLMKLNQATEFGVTRFFRFTMVKDKTRFKKSLQWIVEHWDVSNVIMSHGHVVDTDGLVFLRSAYNSMV